MEVAMHILFNVSNEERIPTDILETNIRRLVENNQPNLDLSNLYIIFSDDTLRDVRYLQEAKGLPIIGHSEHAIGKTLHYIENGEEWHAIVLNYTYFSPFIYEVIDEAFLPAFLINHEIGHIYEHNLTCRHILPTYDFEHIATSLKEAAHYSQASIAFAEYGANFYATRALWLFDDHIQKFDIIINHFYNLLHNYVKEIPQLLEKARDEVNLVIVQQSKLFHIDCSILMPR